MAKSSIIRSVSAVIFIMIFAFGITPKITLHNLVANHKDGKIKASVSDPYATQLSKASFNCQCDNLISESPFIAAKNIAYQEIQPSFAAYKRVFVEEVYSTQLFCSSLRGPPAC